MTLSSKPDGTCSAFLGLQPSHNVPSGAPLPSLSGNRSPLGVKASETELMQKRFPVGGGPSGKT